MNELVEDNFTIFTRIIEFHYEYINLSDIEPYYTIFYNWLNMYHKKWYIDAFTEIAHVIFHRHRLNDPLERCVIHPNTIKTFIEPIDRPEVAIREISNLSSDSLEPLSKPSFANNNQKIKKLLTQSFWNDQKRLVAQDLHNCSKTAWVLPNYMAQDLSRNLIKSGKHSDVGITAYTRPTLYLLFFGLYPLSLVNEYSKLSTSGLVEWWPNFINETYLNVKNDQIPLAKPNMKGHTQVIFYILCGGLTIAFSSMIVEISGILFKFIKAMYTIIFQNAMKYVLQLKRFFALNGNYRTSKYGNN